MSLFLGSLAALEDDVTNLNASAQSNDSVEDAIEFEKSYQEAYLNLFVEFDPLPPPSTVERLPRKLKRLERPKFSHNTHSLLSSGLRLDKTPEPVKLISYHQTTETSKQLDPGYENIQSPFFHPETPPLTPRTPNVKQVLSNFSFQPTKSATVNASVGGKRHPAIARTSKG